MSENVCCTKAYNFCCISGPFQAATKALSAVKDCSEPETENSSGTLSTVYQGSMRSVGLLCWGRKGLSKIGISELMLKQK